MEFVDLSSVQIYTIHIQIDGIMYPVVYALLPSKSEQVYTRFFNLVQRTMITNNDAERSFKFSVAAKVTMRCCCVS
jgi:hypothetical protein